MRIVIPTWSVEHRQGGIRVLMEVAGGLARRGHDVRLLTFDHGGPPAFATAATIERMGPPPPGRHLMRDLLGQRAMRRALAEHADADVLIANHHLTAHPVAATRIAARRVYYVQAYEPDFYPTHWRFAVHRRIARATYRLPLGLVANAPTIARQVAAQARGVRAADIPIVPPGIDSAVFHARGRGAPGARLRVGTISRTETWKGTAECFEAVRRARARGVALDFDVAFGHIPPGFEREERIDSAPADDRALADWYRGLDVLLAAVWWGGAPYPPVEAMACGTAVVSTPNDHVSDGVDALTAPQQDPAALAAALERMASEGALRERLVAAGLRRSERHHWEHVVDAFEDIVSGRTPAPPGAGEGRA